MKPLLLWKSNKSCVFRCLCASALVRAGVGVDVRALACACACVALLIQQETLRHIAICGLSGSTIFFNVIS